MAAQLVKLTQPVLFQVPGYSHTHTHTCNRPHQCDARPPLTSWLSKWNAGAVDLSDVQLQCILLWVFSGSYTTACWPHLGAAFLPPTSELEREWRCSTHCHKQTSDCSSGWLLQNITEWCHHSSSYKFDSFNIIAAGLISRPILNSPPVWLPKRRCSANQYTITS